MFNPRFVPLQHFSNQNEYSCAVDDPTVNVYFFNARSLVNKLLEFAHFIDICKPALVLVCETSFSRALPDSLVCPVGYSVMRKDRIHSVGGGVAIFTRDGLKLNPVSVVCDISSSIDLEIVCVDVTFHSRIRFICCYRPPGYPVSDIDYLKLLVSSISRLTLHMLLK